MTRFALRLLGELAGPGGCLFLLPPRPGSRNLLVRRAP
jgi:hypothetical protein